MHLGDALLSPAVGGAFWVGSAALTGYAARQIHREADAAKTPLMGVMGAFVFAAQMVNFAIPGTGSSGHLGGGLLLAALLGPYRAFLTLASVLSVQCLFFADGGLLALGCNIFNLAFFPAFIAYPFLFKPLAGDGAHRGRLCLASLAAAVVGLLLGAMSVVGQTSASGITSLPMGTFALFMLPIHLAIGLVEGGVTAAVLGYVRQAQPQLLAGGQVTPAGRPVLAVFAVAAAVTGGALAWLASRRPDGLEWAVGKVMGETEWGATDRLHAWLATWQAKLALLPDYAFPNPGASERLGTTASGLLGAVAVLLTAVLLGLLLRRRQAPSGPTTDPNESPS